MTNRLSHIYSILLISLLAIGAAGCRSHKNSVAGAQSASALGESVEPSQLSSPAPVPAADPTAMALAASYAAWTDVQMPVRIELTSPKNFSISGRATLVRGKAMLISLRMLGLEVGSIYADTDTVVIMEKLQKTAYVESLPKFTAAFGLTLSDMQDLMLGRAFAPGSGTLSRDNMAEFTSDSSLFEGEEGLCAISPAAAGAMSLLFAVDESGSRFPMAWVTDAVARVGESATVVLSYDAPTATRAGTVAADAALATNLKGRQISAAIHWSVDEARWDSGAKVAPRSVRGYRLVDTATLLKLLKGITGR